MSKKKWLGPANCDICKTDCTKEKWFVDAKTIHGPWALLCPACYMEHGMPFGQKYNSDKTKICNLHKE